MKKLLSLLLIAVLCVPTCARAAASSGEEPGAYPESAHDYANNCTERWTYAYPAQAEALYVTFSEETCFAPISYDYSVTSDEPEEKREDILRYGIHDSGYGDWLHIYDADGELCVSATTDDLAGRTICLGGNTFTLVLETDGQNTAYGFSIDRISERAPDGFATARYHLRDTTRYDLFRAGETVYLDEDCRMLQDGDQLIVGWKSSDGSAWYYQYMTEWDYARNMPLSEAETDIVAESGGTYDLYPIYCAIAMTKDDVYSFCNGDHRCFQDGYFFTRAQYMKLFTGWLQTFAWSPFLPLIAFAGAFITIVWPTLRQMGSCCGFPITALLQYYGKIDLLSRQGVDTVRELEPDDELASTINYYNVQAAICHPVNHQAIERGTAAYSEQLRALYETLEGDTPVYFEFYSRSQHPLQSLVTGKIKDVFKLAHGILLTGAYTHPDGTHVLIAWENNDISYADGYCNLLTIDADFTDISYGVSQLNGFSWNDTFEQYDSFPTEGTCNPFAWHIQLLKNGPSTLSQLLSFLLHPQGK